MFLITRNTYDKLSHVVNRLWIRATFFVARYEFLTSVVPALYKVSPILKIELLYAPCLAV
jgi:hypothetical protein